MTILNFPASPENGDTYTANGITYTYNNGAWSSNSQESSDYRYVQITGDNMTGDLTLGGGANQNGLTLSTDGNITAVGRADFGSTTHDDRAVVGINSSASGASVTGKNWSNGGFVWQGYNNSVDDVNETSAIKTTGDAIFSGAVTTGVGITFPDGSVQITAATSGGGGGDGEVGTLLEVCTKGNFTSTDINIGNSVVDPRIQLKESDGSITAGGATFSDTVNVGDVLSSPGGSRFRLSDAGGGRIEVRSDTDNRDVFIVSNGGNTADDQTVVIDSSGNVTAAGAVGVGTTTPDSYAKLAVRGHTGSSAGVNHPSAHFSDDENASLWIGHDVGEALVVSNGDISIGYTNGSAAVEKVRIDNPTGNVTVAGSAIVAGDIFTGNKYANGTGALIGTTGYMQLRCDDAASDFILCVKDGNAAINSVFTVSNAGSITAAGSITTDESLLVNGGVAEVYYKSNVIDRFPLRVYSDNGGTKLAKFLVRNTGAVYINGGTDDAVIKLLNDGKIQSTGSMTTGSTANGGGGGNYMAAGEFAAYCNGSGSVFRGWNSETDAGGPGANFLTSHIKSNGDAIFHGTVTADGSVLTRSSGNLDVGDRLEKADNALKALKVSAAAASDFASLKAAVVAALANI